MKKLDIMKPISDIIGGEWIHNPPSETNPCPVCGSNMGYFPSLAKKQYISNVNCCACDESRGAGIEKEKATAELEYIKTNINSIITDRGVPAKYKDMELEAPSGDLNEILNDILNCRSAYIYGYTGRGKSSFAVYAMKELILRGLKPTHVKWYDAPSLCAYIRDGIDTNSYEQRLKECCEFPVLFIDDIGKERSTANNKAIITEIVSYRYENRLQTIITSNLSSSEVIVRYDDRTLSRIKAMLTYQLKGNDRRVSEEW